MNNFKKAIEKINTGSMCGILKKSSIYETRPYGKVKQANFLNAVISVQTDFWLKDLFRFLKRIETEIGRTTTVKWGPREIDLDLLFFDKTVYADFELIVPHPGIFERDFVIVPLCEIEPDFVIPEQEVKISQIDLIKIEKNIISKTDYKL